jgi:hypothetical protein
VDDEFRVEVELDDEQHGYSLGERLRALDLDEDARERVGRGILVTRDGSRLFAYAGNDAQARGAAEVLRGLVEADDLTADIRVTRWHPVEEDWKDASLPLPGTRDEEDAEYRAREAAATREAEAEGEYDWHVVLHARSRDDAAGLADRLAGEGLSVARRWRYVVVGAVTEERAEQLAERLRGAHPDVEVSIEANLSDVRVPAFQFLGF